MKLKERWAEEYLNKLLNEISPEQFCATICKQVEIAFLAGVEKAKEEALAILRSGEELEWSIGALCRTLTN